MDSQCSIKHSILYISTAIYSKRNTLHITTVTYILWCSFSTLLCFHSFGCAGSWLQQHLGSLVFAGTYRIFSVAGEPFSFLSWNVIALQLVSVPAVQWSGSAARVRHTYSLSRLPLSCSPASHPPTSSQSPSCAFCAWQQAPTSCLFHTEQVHTSVLTPISPAFPVPLCGHVSILDTCISIPALKIGSPVSFF